MGGEWFGGCVCVWGGAVGSVLFGLGDVVCLSVECSGGIVVSGVGGRERG
ncbi:hypothetical protein J0A71_10g22700 [Encephalitozoon cuniculi]|nr:hypothetical protein J0A71_05g12290 [Encephalitozoon cuniculi]UYI28172.1 hypothetical protein J0A71_09g20700 [Encephalitozoon cuniculi]UYI28363.1 hypothetical protein J0A71_10g22700 [Encephalitozoon cuniculi]